MLRAFSRSIVRNGVLSYSMWIMWSMMTSHVDHVINDEVIFLNPSSQDGDIG